jgi:hypothetical protein
MHGFMHFTETIFGYGASHSDARYNFLQSPYEEINALRLHQSVVCTPAIQQHKSSNVYDTL